ncbi:MAG: hypothetical protein O3A10_06820 [Chloroflexi bacterium]|nr:hypothetical protein [Chloroflexota bacterium]MDA1147033.1 hypothetical protein [Chloroflexota bacterium]
MTTDVAPEAPVFRKATLEDAPGILRVLEAAFSRWPGFELAGTTPLEHLRWKLTELKADTPSGNHVVTVGGEIVGTRLHWYAPVRVAGLEYDCDGGADVAVHPAWQGRQIGKILVAERDRVAAQARQIQIGTPSRSPQLLHLNDIPDHILRPLPVWERWFRPMAFLRQHRQARRWRALGRDAWRTFGPQRARLLTGPARLERLAAFDERVDALWEVSGRQFDVARTRASEFLNWRYIDPRSGGADVLGAFEGERLVGFAVFKRDGATGNVLDVVVAPARTAVGRQLLVAGSERLRRQGAEQVVCWLTEGHLLEAELAASGFARVGVMTLDLQHRDRVPAGAVATLEASGTRMHVTMGDFDFF